MLIPPYQEKTVKKSHYVPQSYLKRFTFDKEKEHLFVFDKIAEREFPSKISQVAQGKYFYDLPEEDAIKNNFDPQLLEKAFSLVESDFQKALDSVIRRVEKGYPNIFRPELKQKMAYYIGLQHYRTNEFRQVAKELVEKMGEDNLLRKTGIEHEVKADPEFVSLSHNRFITSREFKEAVTQILLNHLWMVGVNKTKMPLYTSDNPVALRPYVGNNYLMSYTSFESEGIEISFPISPKYVLIIREKTFHWRMANANNKAVNLSPYNVEYYNQLQIAQSNRQIYSLKNDFEFAKTILKRNPEFRNPDRQRVVARRTFTRENQPGNNDNSEA